MDIRKIVRRILSEQPEGENVPNPVQQLSNAQRELLARWSVRWKETLPHSNQTLTKDRSYRHPDRDLETSAH